MSKFPLSTAISPSDWDGLFVVNCHCFNNTPISIFFPRGLDPAAREDGIQGMKIGVFGGPVERAYAFLRSPTTGEPAAFISCKIYRGERGLVDADAPSLVPRKIPSIEDEHERAFWERCWTNVDATMREVEEFQAPHLYVQVLATDPAWQGQGAAAKLLQWAFDVASKEKMGRCLLQCSPQKQGFYERFGFRALGTHAFVDEQSFPGRIGLPLVRMIRLC